MKEKMTERVKAHTRYKLKDGTIVPGASTIAGLRDKSHVLVKWANQLGLQGIDSAKYTDEKADIGKCAHYRILCDLTGKEPVLDEFSKEVIDKSDNCLLSYLEWRKQHEITLLYDEKGTPLCEYEFVSEEDKYGGCIDLYANIDGVRELIDFKTGKAIYDGYFIQVGAYEMLLHSHGYQVENRRILNIPRNEDEVFYEKTETEKRMNVYKKIFFDLLDVYWREKELKGV